MKNKSLAELRERSGLDFRTYNKLKEFIKRLKEELQSAQDTPIATKEGTRALDFCLNQIDKLAGSALI